MCHSAKAETTMFAQYFDRKSVLGHCQSTLARAIWRKTSKVGPDRASAEEGSRVIGDVN